MNTARLAIIGIAAVAGLSAAYLMMGSKPEPVPVAAPMPTPVAPPPKPVEAVLVAARDLPFGSVLADGDLRWQPWPESAVPMNAIVRSTQPMSLEELKGSVLRTPISASEPIKSDRLARRTGSGFMAAVLPVGMRAVAIDLADQGKTAAGGFILPNDRIDVIRTYHPDDAPPGVLTSETLLANIRVLAIGQSVQEKSNERTVIGGTATLEMTPSQAEKVVLAQRTGQLTLSLRSMGDVAATDAPPSDMGAMTVIRSGNVTQTRKR